MDPVDVMFLRIRPLLSTDIASPWALRRLYWDGDEDPVAAVDNGVVKK
ncbi:MAG TPA: hypothetical protein PL010_15985 [Flavobacteriales bacterium]|nr:hypothetical protein [Flavobacteriales bacterium]